MSEYIHEKIIILKHFCITLNNEQKDKIRGLKSEIAIDNYVRSLILHSLFE